MSELSNKEILFVLGAARSGTTYFNNFMDRWFDYGMGPEGTFVEPFHRRLPKYGDLSKAQNLSRLVEDVSRCQMLEILRKRRRDANRLDVTPQDIHDRLLEPTYAGVVYSVFQCIADHGGKSRVGNKNPGYWTHLSVLDALFPVQAKYIAVVRDGRDAFLSLQGQNWGGHSAFAAARRWYRAQAAIGEFQDSRGPDKMLILYYDDLLRSPAETIQKLERFLNISLPPEIRAAALAEANANPLKDNFRRWPSRIAENDRRVYEALAGDMLEKHGYETLAQRPTLGFGEKLFFETKELVRLLKINAYHMRNKLPGDTKKRVRQVAESKQAENEQKAVR